MQYLLLICDDEKHFAARSESEAQATTAQYRTLIQEMAQSGRYKGGNQLQPSHTATTVRVRNGARQTTDGPFAETREQLGGYFLIDASDLDDAIAIAERIPAAKTGSIEVRPIQPVNMPVTA